MKSSVIVFPGSNCDRDIADALVKMQFKNQWKMSENILHLCLSSPQYCQQEIPSHS